MAFPSIVAQSGGWRARVGVGCGEGCAKSPGTWWSVACRRGVRLAGPWLKKAAAMPNEKINLADPDAPLVTDWSGGERGKFFKPVKRLKSFHIDADVLAYFEGQGKGYQSLVNQVLREAMQNKVGK